MKSHQFCKLRILYNLSFTFQKYHMSTKRDKNRDFTERIKAEERISANNKCRMCGSDQVLEFAHIYTNSKNIKWSRKGSNTINSNNDDFVSSKNNCILLCHIHHSKIDSQKGLELCSTEYLNSLKESQSYCTAMTEKNQRCKRLNSRIKDGNYRCKKHSSNGGIENDLPNRTWVKQKKDDEIEQESYFKGYCGIL
jgi:hypothetical protein